MVLPHVKNSPRRSSPSFQMLRQKKKKNSLHTVPCGRPLRFPHRFDFAGAPGSALSTAAGIWTQSKPLSSDWGSSKLQQRPSCEVYKGASRIKNLYFNRSFVRHVRCIRRVPCSLQRPPRPILSLEMRELLYFLANCLKFRKKTTKDVQFFFR